MADDPHSTPDELDAGLAFAYGDDSAAAPAPSVLERIGEVTGSKPRVLLKEEAAGDTPILKPLGPGERREAGKYVVQGELGRGGVGAVHKGHDQDLGRDVAMKFLHARYKDDPGILHRFVEEAQIGGQLQHPGIVPVYDLGLVDGKPFFTMKLVKGQTLARKLAVRASPTEDRRSFLAIFEDICQTLAYAHARGVVHRDLKPANIMIGSFGEVQVVDWGMGKVLRQGGVADEKLAAERQAQLSVIETVRSGGHGTQSLVGSMMGTPAYMPPEQARGDVDAMDERSDVFALGAILCEILTGKPPYVGETEDVIGMASLAKLDDAHARLDACGAEPEMVELTKRCLMPAPAARPRSAEVVAKAVHDHLAAAEARVHEARVEAAKAKVRAASLKRTQTLGISLTAVIAIGLAASTWFWRAADAAAKSEKEAKLAAVASAETARENEQRAVEQTAVAERELARAVEIKTLITDMLKGIQPEQAQGRDITLLREILDTAAARLAEGAIQDELVAAELHGVIGGVYNSLGLYAEAERHLPVALEIRERVLGPEDELTLKSADGVAVLRVSQGHYAEAEELFLRTLETRERLFGEEHEDTIRSMSFVAAVYSRQDRDAESLELSRRILELQRESLGDDHEDTLVTRQNIASHLMDHARYAEAEAAYLEIIELLEKQSGADHPMTIVTRGNLASLYESMGRYAEAEPLQRQVHEQRRRVLGPEHPQTLTGQLALAQVLVSLGKRDEAEPYVLQALEVQERLLGPDHPDTLRSVGMLGTICLQQNKMAEAEAYHRRAYETRKRVLGEEHGNTLASLGNLAIVYQETGRYAEAEEVYERLSELQLHAFGEEHPNLIGTRLNLASLYEKQGRPLEAESVYHESMVVQERLFGAKHPDTLLTKHKLAMLYLQQDRVDEAAPLVLECWEVRKEVLGPDHEKTLDCLATLARVRQVEERFDEAQALFEQLVPALARVLGEDHPMTLGNQGNLAMLYHQQGRLEEAEDLFLRTLESQKRSIGEEHEFTLGTYTNLGNLYLEMGRYQEAAEMFEVSLPIKRRVLGEDHPWTGFALQGLMRAYLSLGRFDEALPLQREVLERAFTEQEGEDADAAALNEFAWLLLNADFERLRDPERALEFASRACALEEAREGLQLWMFLDTLASAQHATGDTTAAVATQKRALELMPEGADEGVQERLEEYEAALEDDSND
ncbi:MAG: tetratricopeptide repeat protein [Planctomycetes bacterium]|nr:tetratricopeptide repeat protein [Planctomycetota bacterium]MCB9905912.1 tetratricopeptide repeat protein [Planctomycetota bacterium]